MDGSGRVRRGFCEAEPFEEVEGGEERGVSAGGGGAVGAEVGVVWGGVVAVVCDVGAFVDAEAVDREARGVVAGSGDGEREGVPSAGVGGHSAVGEDRGECVVVGEFFEIHVPYS